MVPWEDIADDAGVGNILLLYGVIDLPDMAGFLDVIVTGIGHKQKYPASMTG